VAALVHQPLDLGHRRAEGEGDDVVPPHHHLADRPLGQVEGAREEVRLRALDRPLGPGLREHHGQLLGGVGRGQLLLGLQADEAHRPVGDRVEQPDERPEDQHEEPVGQREGEEGRFRTSDGQVLGDHLADHEVEERDQQQGDPERHAVLGRVREAERSEP
jgi:hypothetical protein